MSTADRLTATGASACTPSGARSTPGIVQVRNDNHHKATAAIAKCAGRVVVETLNVSGMLRNRRLARAIADAGMSGLLAKLEYKCAWYGAGVREGGPLVSIV